MDFRERFRELIWSAFVNSYGALSERFRSTFGALSERFQRAFGALMGALSGALYED